MKAPGRHSFGASVQKKKAAALFEQFKHMTAPVCNGLRRAHFLHTTGDPLVKIEDCGRTDA